MLIFGGFDGRLKSDVLVYVVGVCTSLTTKEHCLTAMPGVKCVWNKAAKKCEPLASVSKEGYEKCPSISKFIYNASHIILERDTNFFSNFFYLFCFSSSVFAGNDQFSRMVFLSLTIGLCNQFNVTVRFNI